ncbi:hypothetical protein C2L64_03675 [Paraburkholderia hospita]|uniref:Uncharacterized protein n=1 Tax=Paraburkholderia hospita TaxID=169430 RepID=A0AAN1MHR1_9BURK|nr:hypothetical protein C2L64_03675 [Paraburkholderia hospita]
MGQGFRQHGGSTPSFGCLQQTHIEANRSASKRNPSRSNEAANNGTQRPPCCAPPALVLIF